MLASTQSDEDGDGDGGGGGDGDEPAEHSASVLVGEKTLSAKLSSVISY